MRFRSNTCVAIHLKSLAKAEHFYGDVLGFRLIRKTKAFLEFDTGALRLFVNRSARVQAPTPSFSVKDIAKARRLLKGAGWAGGSAFNSGLDKGTPDWQLGLACR